MTSPAGAFPSPTFETAASIIAKLTGAATLAVGAMLYGQGTSVAATLAAPTNDGSRWALSNPGAAAPAWNNQAAWKDQANTFSAAQVISAATGLTVRQAVTQDAVALIGRAGGTSSYVASITPATLSGNRTITIPDATGTLALLGLAQTWTAQQTFGGLGYLSTNQIVLDADVGTAHARLGRDDATSNYGGSAEWSTNYYYNSGAQKDVSGSSSGILSQVPTSTAGKYSILRWRSVAADGSSPTTILELTEDGNASFAGSLTTALTSGTGIRLGRANGASAAIDSLLGNLIRHRAYGYSPSYTAVQISDNARGVGFGVDPNAITGSQFSGDARDVFFRRGSKVLIPNAGATDWETLLYLESGSNTLSAPIVTIATAGLTVAGITTTTTASVIGTTASTSTTTGALVVSGGVGIAGDIFNGGKVSSTASSAITSASYNLHYSILTANPASASSAVFSAGNFLAQTSGTQNLTATNGLVGAILEADHYSSGTMADMYGAKTIIIARSGCGNIASAQACGFRVQNLSAATISTAIGAYVQGATNTGGGAITVNYGIKIEDQTVGGTNYAIYTGSGAVRLGDTLTTVGNACVGGAVNSSAVLSLGTTNPLSGAVQVAAYAGLVNTAAATTRVSSFYSAPTMTNASYTTAYFAHFDGVGMTVPANVTVTSWYGMFINAPTFTGTVTNAYGARLQIASGSNRWNIYCDGTASNHMAGQLLVGTTTDGMTAGGSLAIAQDLAHRGSKAGFYNTAPATKPTVTGSRGGNAALASLLTSLSGLGLLTDSSSA